jgi:hypothetical protein
MGVCPPSQVAVEPPGCEQALQVFDAAEASALELLESEADAPIRLEELDRPSPHVPFGTKRRQDPIDLAAVDAIAPRGNLR